MEDKCVCCGQYVPDGRQVCPICEKKFGHVKQISTFFYDKEEIYENCTVQILTNTNTGDVSVGWWKNETE